MKSTEQTIQVTCDEDHLGTFTVDNLPEGSANSFTANIQPVSNAAEILAAGETIHYSVRLFDTTGGGMMVVHGDDYCQTPDGVTGDYPALDTSSSGGQAISYNDLQDGHTYYYHIVATAPGYGFAVWEAPFLAKSGENDSGIAVTVNGNTGSLNLETGAGFHVHVAFENSLPEYPEVVRVLVGGQQVPLRQIASMGNNTIDFDYSMDGREGTVIVYAQTGTQNEAGERTWTATSNAVAISFASPALGTLEPATFTMCDSEGNQKQTFTQGEYLYVTVNSIDPYTQNMNVNVENPDYTIHRGEYRSAPDTPIQVPTVSLEPGTYMLNVDSMAPDYRMSRSTAIFTVTAPEGDPGSDPKVILTATSTNILTNQSVLISGYAPGAADLQLCFLDDPNDNNGYDFREWNEDSFDMYYSWPTSGTKYLKLTAYIHGVNDPIITTLAIEVGAPYGDTTDPVITVPATLTKGSDLEVAYTATGADRVHITLFEQGGDRYYHMQDRTIRLGDNKSGSCRFDKSLFDLNRMYKVAVESLTLGQNGGYADATFLVVGSTIDSSKTVTLRINNSDRDLQPLRGENLTVSISAPGATAVRLYQGDSWAPPITDIENGTAETMISFWNDATVFAMASYDDVDYSTFTSEQWLNWDWDTNVSWTGLSNSIHIHPVSNGQLAAPQFHLNSNEVVWGDPLTVTFDNVIRTSAGEIPTGNTWYYMRVEQAENNNDWMYVSECSVNSMEGEYLLPTFALTPGSTCRVSIRADGEGWDSSQTVTEQFTVAARQESNGAPEHFIVSKNALQTQEQAQVLIYDPDAEWINVDITRDGDPGWNNWMNNGGSTLNQTWSTGLIGSYTLTAYACRNSQDQNNTFEQAGSGNWRRLIGTQTVTVSAPNGSLPAPVVTGVPLLLHSGEGINGTIQIDEHATSCYIQFSYVPDDYSSWTTIRDISDSSGHTEFALVIPAADLPLGRYCLNINTEAPGYEATNVQQWVLVEQPKEKSIVLKANGSTEDIAAYPVSKSLTVSVSDPNATHVRFLNDDSFGQPWVWGDQDMQNSGVFVWYHGFSIGTHRLYAQASYDGGNTWTAESNVISVTIESRGRTRAVDLAIQQESVVSSVPLNVTVSLAEGDGTVPTQLSLTITDPDGMCYYNNQFVDGLTAEDYPLTVQIPTDWLSPGTYTVRAHASAEWYEGSESVAAQTFRAEEAVTSGQLDSLNWEIFDTSQLRISGSGAIPGFESAEGAPWYPLAANITRIYLDSGVSAIGNYAFSGFSHAGLRVDFNQAALPTIAANAFSGTTAVCRYYTADASFEAAGQYGGTLEWIYLPVSNQYTENNALDYRADSGWTFQERLEEGYVDILVTPVQARELTLTDRWINLYDLPASADDLNALNALADGAHHLGFMESCAGEYTLNLSAASTLSSIDLSAPELSLTIYDSRAQGLNRLNVSKGTATCNGNLYDLLLRTPETSLTPPTVHPSVTVNGNVENLNFYGPGSPYSYTGNLTVNGTIVNGTEYGSAEIAIPGISDAVQFPEMLTTTLNNISQRDPIVLNGQLNVEDAVSVGNLDISMFELTYHLYSDGWRLDLRGREESGLSGYPFEIDNVLDYNPNFTADDMIWGEDTSLYVSEPGDYDHIVLNGSADGLGLREVSATSCDITINCPVQRVNVQRYTHNAGASSVRINAPVQQLYLNLRRSGDSVALGQGGSVQYGSWDRMLMSDRSFGPVSGPCDLYRNDQLCVLNWRPGEQTQVIMPSEGALTAAAGLSDGQKAMMDVSDSSVNELSPVEQEALEAYLTQSDLSMSAVSSVFDVSVSSYDVNSESYIGDLTELNSPVDVSVKNTTGGTGSVVRLHENNDGSVAAEAVSQTTDSDVIAFSSSLYSKYVIVSAELWNTPTYEWAADNNSVTARRTSQTSSSVQEETVGVSYVLASSPTQTAVGSVTLTSAPFRNRAFAVQTKTAEIPALGSMQVLTLPASLTTVEAEAFANGAFEAVVVPAGCTSIADGAFANCGSLKYIRIPGANTAVSDTAFQGCGLVIVDRTPLS